MKNFGLGILSSSYSLVMFDWTILTICLQEKASGKSRQGSVPVKETVQEYIGGADTITEDPATRDYVVTRARLMSAKYVRKNNHALSISMLSHLNAVFFFLPGCWGHCVVAFATHG